MLTPLIQAFVLTRGTTHYRTEDRGQSWRSFEMPVPPSYVPRPLSFHSDPAKYGYVLYQATKCEREDRWSSMCHDEVRLPCLSAHPRMPDTLERRTIPKKPSQIIPNYFSPRLPNAPLPIVQPTLSTTPTLISYIALPLMPPPRTGTIPSPRPVSSRPQTSSPTRPG